MQRYHLSSGRNFPCKNHDFSLKASLQNGLFNQMHHQCLLTHAGLTCFWCLQCLPSKPQRRRLEDLLKIIPGSRKTPSIFFNHPLIQPPFASEETLYWLMLDLDKLQQQHRGQEFGSPGMNNSWIHWWQLTAPWQRKAFVAWSAEKGSLKWGEHVSPKVLFKGVSREQKQKWSYWCIWHIIYYSSFSFI